MKTAKCSFIGIQPGFERVAPFALYNLEERIGTTPAKGTVSAHFLETSGYEPPADQKEKADAAMEKHCNERIMNGNLNLARDIVDLFSRPETWPLTDADRVRALRSLYNRAVTLIEHNTPKK